jgi:signal transduction histidine kinase
MTAVKPKWPYTRKDWLKLAVVFLSITAVSVAHYVTPQSEFWQSLSQHLYYVPIVFGAVWFGWLGGIAAALCSGLCFIFVPYMVHLKDTFSAEYAEVLIFFLVGGVTGLLSARERSRREDLARTTKRLEAVNQELVASLEQLKRADRLSAVGRLSAGLAHEIRNPIASIEGAIDILERTSHDLETREEEFLGIIKKECARVNRLLSDLLDFGRPRQPQLRTITVAEIIDSVVTLVKPGAERQNVQLITAVSSNPTVRVDPAQIEQVILNLILNAIQAMPRGGSVTISSSTDESAANIDVRDEGVGIPPEDFHKIFDPFYTTKERGIGLGLSVADQIVKAHEGKIDLFPNPTGGMTFRVVLPIDRH